MFDGIIGDELGTVQNDDVGADALDCIEFMGTEEDDFTARGKFLN